jgi:cytochrome c oxidase assembly protein Cox11
MTIDEVDPRKAVVDLFGLVIISNPIRKPKVKLIKEIYITDETNTDQGLKLVFWEQDAKNMEDVEVGSILQVKYSAKINKSYEVTCQSQNIVLNPDHSRAEALRDWNNSNNS